ncbi:MAG: glycosyltransferase family 4 protein [Acidimicrobiia bacterium]
MRVLRVYHSAVVSEWRQRDRELRATGVDVTLVSAARWNEGGKVVACEPGADAFVRPARTWGTHPYLFVYDPRVLWKALDGDFDVVDVHEEPASLAALEVRILMALRNRTRRAKLLLYCAQNIEKRYPIPFRWFERSALRHAAGVYCCNDEAGRILRRKNFRGALTTLGLGVNVERFSPASGKSGDDALTIGYVGRLEEHKGVHVLIEALAKVPDAELRIVGDGPYRVELQQAATRYGVAERVHFGGYAGQDALPELYRSFDVLVVPSIPTAGWIEQFGRVAVEAMASGVPVVASASGSLPEVVGDGGVLVEPNDAVALADALDDLINDGARRRALSEAAHRRAQRYSWRSIADGHRAFYERVTQ